MTTVLVADADVEARRTTMTTLRFGGHAVEAARRPEQLRSMLRERRYDAVVIDPWNHGESEPWANIADVRAQTEAALLVVSRSSDDWRAIAALDAGADDYLAKPYIVEELLARLRAVLRRGGEAMTAEPPVVTPDFTADVANRRWWRADGSEVRLTPTEWRLVEVLMRRAGRLIGHADLLASVWGPEAVDKPAYLRVHLAAIRHKVEPDPARPRYFITAAGLGHRFEVPTDVVARST